MAHAPVPHPHAPLPHIATRTRHFCQVIGDYISLTKPRVVVLLLLTTWAALVIASDTLPSASLLFWTLSGGYLASGGAGAVNCAVEGGTLDRRMARTCNRPVAAGRIVAWHALLFGVACIVLAWVILFNGTTPLAAWLALLGTCYYTVIYTVWLKRTTWYNVVISGGAGAIPPLVGWAAATGRLAPTAWVLATLIFVWSPAHFWSLALLKKQDYALACIPTLPNHAGNAVICQYIRWYTLLTMIISLVPVTLHRMGWCCCEACGSSTPPHTRQPYAIFSNIR